jgi:hypothetical protein
MSQIFYSQVDKNLQQELNARAGAGSNDRSTAAIAYMTEKIANIELQAYLPADSGSNRIHGSEFASDYGRLGGFKVRSNNRYLPSGIGGYLNSGNNQYKYETVTIQEDENQDLTAVLQSGSATDLSRRIGPYVKVVDITIGDGSMGLLNKATVAIEIPNPGRDLDRMESVWMRPGRYVRLKVKHPESALLTEGQLSDNLIPNKKKLAELYPLYLFDTGSLEAEIKAMNQYTFNGLVTSFDMSYGADATVSVTLQLTGTSDIYTDVSMFMDPQKKKKNSKTNTYAQTSTTGSENTLRNVDTQDTGSAAAQTEIYEQLSSIVEQHRLQYYSPEIVGSSESSLSLFSLFQGIMPFRMPNEETNTNVNDSATDNFVLFGQPFSQNIRRDAGFDAYYEEPDPFSYTASAAYDESNRPKITDPVYTVSGSFDTVAFNSASAQFNSGSAADFDTQLKQYESSSRQDKERQRKQFEQEESLVTELTDDNRYITLGALIHFLNNEILYKQGNENGIGVLCSDAAIDSTYYENLKSTEPEVLLMLPKDPTQKGDMNWYGDTGYYENVILSQQDRQSSLQKAGIYREWKGVYDNESSSQGKIFPSRIFINLETIKSIIDELSNYNARRFTFGAFITSLSAVISEKTAGAIKLVLTADKNNSETVLLADSNYTNSDNVTPYKIPMFANDPRGTIVRDFQFSAKLPNSVKNLSYVLNQGTGVTSEKIAPYMNFMFNADDPETVNKIIRQYKATHEESISNLSEAAKVYGLEPQDAETRRNLKSAMIEYLKYPTADIRKSQQLTAPIFPFDVSFTIDGINGFRYGDVLEFPGLPKKYTENTVFSIISIVHNISSEGAWTTKITCIMRPNI